MDEVHTDDAERFLLAQTLFVERPHVNDDRRGIARADGLEI
ncbi:MAG: hypothetical protein WDM76_13470 [Limisphaerales bacterium]